MRVTTLSALSSTLLAVLWSAPVIGAESGDRARLEGILETADVALVKTSDPAEQARLQAIRAQALLGLGQDEGAKAAFLTALQKEPAVDLDALHANPEALRLLESARRELPATVTVLIPKGRGSVSIDGRDLGPAPLQVQLSGGAHQLSVKVANGRRVRFETSVSPGRRVILELEFDATRLPKERASDAPPRRVTERWAPPLVAVMDSLERDEPATGSSPTPPGTDAPGTALGDARSPPAKPDPLRRAWAYGLGAASLALIAGGAGFGVATLDEAAQARSAIGTSPQHALHEGRANTYAMAADALYIAGALAAGAAIWLFVASTPARAPAAPSASLSVGPIRGGAALSISGAF